MPRAADPVGNRDRSRGRTPRRRCRGRRGGDLGEPLPHAAIGCAGALAAGTAPAARPARPEGVRRTTDDDEVVCIEHERRGGDVDDLHGIEAEAEAVADRSGDGRGVAEHRLVDDECTWSAGISFDHGPPVSRLQRPPPSVRPPGPNVTSVGATPRDVRPWRRTSRPAHSGWLDGGGTMRATPGHRSRAGDDAAPGDPFCAVVALRDGHHRDLAPDVARRLGADGDVPVTIVDLVSPGRDPWPGATGAAAVRSARSTRSPPTWPVATVSSS